MCMQSYKLMLQAALAFAMLFQARLYKNELKAEKAKFSSS